MIKIEQLKSYYRSNDGMMTKTLEGVVLNGRFKNNLFKGKFFSISIMTFLGSKVNTMD